MFGIIRDRVSLLRVSLLKLNSCSREADKMSEPLSCSYFIIQNWAWAWDRDWDLTESASNVNWATRATWATWASKWENKKENFAETLSGPKTLSLSPSQSLSLVRFLRSDIWAAWLISSQVISFQFNSRFSKANQNTSEMETLEEERSSSKLEHTHKLYFCALLLTQFCVQANKRASERTNERARWTNARAQARAGRHLKKGRSLARSLCVRRRTRLLLLCARTEMQPLDSSLFLFLFLFLCNKMRRGNFFLILS